MKFGPRAVAETEGHLLGHSLTIGTKRLKKGRRLSAEDVALIEAAGHESLIVAELEADDVAEDEAATRIALAATGSGVETQAAFTGRCNLYAETAGVVLVDPARVDRINEIDEALTIATLSPFDVVEARQMLATIKVIPFSAPGKAVAEAARIAAEGEPLVRLAPFVPHRVGLVMTRLPQTRDSVLLKTTQAVEKRLAQFGSRLIASRTCPHEEAAVEAAVRELIAAGADPVLIFGASAIVDRRDVVPTGIVRAGGTLENFGMPVDPGNLLLLARHGVVPVVGLPGCARSPRLNGFDWVLSRLLANLTMSRADLVRLGAGGLLKEIAGRPQPRAGEGTDHSAATPVKRAPKIAALILAAGQSRRMGRNKLLEVIAGQPMVARIADRVLGSSARPVVVVTGFEAERIRAALGSRAVSFAHNSDYAEGLSTSLRTGLDALPADIDGAVICLGDMPNLEPAHIESLIAGFNPTDGRAILVPTADGKRGNPVLWSAAFFPEMRRIAGDVGARHLIGEHDDVVCEIAIDQEGILLDLDTPEALEAFAARKTSS